MSSNIAAFINIEDNKFIEDNKTNWIPMFPLTYEGKVSTHVKTRFSQNFFIFQCNLFLEGYIFPNASAHFFNSSEKYYFSKSAK